MRRKALSRKGNSAPRARMARSPAPAASKAAPESRLTAAPRPAILAGMMFEKTTLAATLAATLAGALVAAVAVLVTISVLYFGGIKHDNRHRAEAERHRHEESMTALKELIRRTGSPARAVRFHPGDRPRIIRPGDRFGIVTPKRLDRADGDGEMGGDGVLGELPEWVPPPKRP